MLETMQFKQDEALFWFAERLIVEQQSREKENLEQIVEADLDHAHLAFVLQLIALTDTICKINLDLLFTLDVIIVVHCVIIFNKTLCGQWINP